MRTVRATSFDDLPTAVRQLGLPTPRPVLALIGGAGRMGAIDLSVLFAEAIAPAIRQAGALAVDGGTDTGVMRLLGRARAETGRAGDETGRASEEMGRAGDELGRAGDDFPLVGVTVEELVEPRGDVPLEPHHTHCLLVPGTEWGEDARYLARVATLLSAGAPAVTVLVNGGEIAYADCFLSIQEKRPVLVLAGTGRTADDIATAASHPADCRDDRAVELARSGWVRVEQVTNRTAVAARLLEHLSR